MHPERQKSVIYVPVADRKRKIKLHNPLKVSSQKTHKKNKKRRICVKRQVPPPQLTGRKTRKSKHAKRFSFGTICGKKKKKQERKEEKIMCTPTPETQTTTERPSRICVSRPAWYRFRWLAVQETFAPQTVSLPHLSRWS